jgi:RNA polymerase sigma-70 factor (ECF subfamily)
MDRYELEQKILDSKVDPQEKYQFLWEYYYPRLLIYMKSFKKIPDAERADVVSDILLKVFNNLQKYNRLYSLSTWVYNIAKNYALDLYRKINKSPQIVSDGKIDEQAVCDKEQNDFAGAIAQKDAAEKCRQCINSLNKKDRRIVFLRYYEGLNAKEISLIEGISHNAIRQRLRAVKSRIKKLLGDDYEY